MNAGTLCHFVGLSGDKLATEHLAAIPARNETISFGDDAQTWVVAGVHHAVGGSGATVTLYLASLQGAGEAVH